MSKMEMARRDDFDEGLSWQLAQKARESRLLWAMQRHCDGEIARKRRLHRWNALRLLWRICRPAPAARKAVELLILRGSPYFDADWYFSNAPDVAGSGLSAERHYLRHGGYEGRDPGPFFSSATYLKLGEDVAASGLNPLIHFHIEGKSEGRWAAAPRTKWAAMPPIPDRVVYVVGHTLPSSSNGYAIRTHEVAKALGRAGHDVVVVLFPGRPWSIEGFDPNEPVQMDRRIEGVRYITLPARDLLGLSPETANAASAALLSKAFAALRPASVIAASNWRIAGPAAEAARRQGPFFSTNSAGSGKWALGTFPLMRPSAQERSKSPGLRARSSRLARKCTRKSSAGEFHLNASSWFRTGLLRRGRARGRLTAKSLAVHHVTWSVMSALLRPMKASKIFSQRSPDCAKTGLTSICFASAAQSRRA